MSQFWAVQTLILSLKSRYLEVFGSEVAFFLKSSLTILVIFLKPKYFSTAFAIFWADNLSLDNAIHLQTASWTLLLLNKDWDLIWQPCRSFSIFFFVFYCISQVTILWATYDPWPKHSATCCAIFFASIVWFSYLNS